MTFLVGCAQLQHGQAPEPVKVVDPAHGLMMAECSGLASDFSVCHQTAAKACPAGYIVDESVSTFGNTGRQFIFKCK
ncbi:MAG TPA: hypothetical protein VIE69_09980 [Methylophilaceae bacterium]